MSIFRNIKDGWSNYLNAFSEHKGMVDPKVENIARERANICKSCPSLVESRIFTVIETMLPNGKVQESLTEDKLEGNKVQGYKCSECGCGFPANVFAPDKRCPLKKW